MMGILIAATTDRVGLLITGIPAAGKSTFLERLESSGWRVLRGDEANGWPPGYHEAWEAALAGSPATLVSLAQSERTGLAIEWGFKAVHLKYVLALQEAGFEAWFFDGDDNEAFERWRRVHPNSPRGEFDSQIAGLRASASDIVAAFGERRVETIPKDGPAMTIDEIEVAVFGEDPGTSS